MQPETVENKGIDMDLYSRQIGTFGMEAMQKLVKLDVLIVGMRGLGVETAKNLILAGPGSVTIFDPTMVRIEDLSSNFYLKENQVGKKSRAASCVPVLQELNPHVKVKELKSLEPNDCAKFTVCVFTENLSGF
jgi:ubiquitin-activating enzyme E1